MRIFDLSQPLYDGAPNCPVHPPVEIPVTADHPADGWRMEVFHMASHTGTHLDAPLHKLAGGKSIDEIPLESFVGEAVVADLTHLGPDYGIDARDLDPALSGYDLTDKIVLLNTGWGHKRAKTEEWLRQSPFLTPEGAEWLVKKKARAVGIDHFSIGGSREPSNERTHEILLGAGLWVVEDLRFPVGWQEAIRDATFQAIPLFLRGFSGSPCRALLISNP